MNMKIIILEDSSIEAERLKKGISTYGQKHYLNIDIDEYKSGEDYFSSNPDFRENQPSAFFLDIQMNKLNGIDVAKRLRLLGYKGIIVFLTAFREYVFKGIKLWNMPEITIESKVKSMYEKTQEVIRTGNIVNHIDERGRRITNFPGMSDNGVCHVRPHGRDSKDSTLLPVKDKVTGAIKFTKQCFWFNNSYLKEIVAEFL